MKRPDPWHPWLGIAKDLVDPGNEDLALSLPINDGGEPVEGLGDDQRAVVSNEADGIERREQQVVQLETIHEIARLSHPAFPKGSLIEPWPVMHRASSSLGPSSVPDIKSLSGDGREAVLRPPEATPAHSLRASARSIRLPAGSA